MKPITVLFATLLLLAACTEPSQEQRETEPSMSQPSVSSTPAEAERSGDVQVIEIEAGTSGYSPDRIALTPGVPARLVFTRTADAACIQHVSIPAFGVEKTELPLHEEKVIEITPTEEGEFIFTCGMDMQEGSILVAA